MGDNHTLDDSGLPECYPSSFDVHLSAKEIQSWREGKGWERIQAPDCCIDAGKQMYVRCDLLAHHCTNTDNM